MIRKVFGMVSTAPSTRYTVEALRSFGATTTLQPGDRFLLIDNDASLDGNLPTFPGLERVTNDIPKAFAANFNRTLTEAREIGADLYFLNNDLVFTTEWLAPLTIDAPAVLSPVSNAEVEYESGGLACRFAMDLEDYVGREHELAVIGDRHRQRARGYLSVFGYPFFCVKLPFSVYSVVGDLDEAFGPGGGEDKDYCIRTLLAGFPLRWALGSYVLHFQGKSTWRGPEDRDQTARRDQALVAAFRAKWGETLTRLFIFQDERVVAEAGLSDELREGRLADIVRALSPEP